MDILPLLLLHIAHVSCCKQNKVIHYNFYSTTHVNIGKLMFPATTFPNKNVVGKIHFLWGFFYQLIVLKIPNFNDSKMYKFSLGMWKLLQKEVVDPMQHL
jgi:hypothetical protein